MSTATATSGLFDRLSMWWQRVRGPRFPVEEVPAQAIAEMARASAARGMSAAERFDELRAQNKGLLRQLSLHENANGPAIAFREFHRIGSRALRRARGLPDGSHPSWGLCVIQEDLRNDLAKYALALGAIEEGWLGEKTSRKEEG